MHGRLLHLFPDFKEGDWDVVDRGTGAAIENWNRVEPQPSQATIDAVTVNEGLTASKNYLANEELDNLKALKALALVVADLTGKTPAQIKSLFITKYKSL